jgi:hypothetical protein
MKQGENKQSPSAQPHADASTTYNAVRPGSPGLYKGTKIYCHDPWFVDYIFNIK